MALSLASLSYPFGGRPDHAETMEVAPGVLWIRMQIPIPGLDFINLWLLEEDDGWAVVDTGLQSKKTIAWWEEIFSRYLKGKPVTRVICTHFHPDHMGLAGWFVSRWGDIPLWMTFGEWAFGRMIWLDINDKTPQSALDFYWRIGWDEAQLAEFKKRGFGRFSRVVAEVPFGIRRISHGERFTVGGSTWQVLVGEGHSPEHACLYCPDKNLMISGDQVLPRITPHIGIYPSEPEANPLGRYLDSLDRFRTLPEDLLILPAHGDPFYGLHARLDQLHAHHAERLSRLFDACEEPMTAARLIPSMFKRQLSPDDWSLASAEGLAHLHYLISDGKLRREVAEDGRYRYRRADCVAAA